MLWFLKRIQRKGWKSWVKETRSPRVLGGDGEYDEKKGVNE